MKHFRKFTSEDLKRFVNLRKGETRIGETIHINEDNTARFEIYGIPESVGVRANYGIGGTETAWETFLKTFLNLQENTFLSGNTFYFSGYFDFPALKEANIEELRQQVALMDIEVTQKMKQSIEAGRIPIVIGGGHNNAYGNIKGASQALKMPVSVINFDAHADYRPLEGRHSGNGFSYADSEGYLGQYAIFGLQKYFVSESMLNELESHKKIQIQYFDEIYHLDTASFKIAVSEALKHTASMPLGLEMDLDAIENVLSSATSPVGFSIHQALTYIRELRNAENLCYLHLCEGASVLYGGRSHPAIGKLLSLLVAEFCSE